MPLSGVGRLRSPPLDPVLGLVVVHRLLSLGQEGVHALVRTQEPVHAHNGLEGQDAVGCRGVGGKWRGGRHLKISCMRLVYG